MWRVTLAAPQRPSCRRTLASISCSVKRATPAAPSPASRPASRLWRARGRSSAPKPTKDHRNWAPPPPSASPFPSQKGRSWVGRPLDSLKGLSESNCGRVWLLFSCVVAWPGREWESIWSWQMGFRRCKQMMCTTYCTLLDAFDLLSGWWILHLLVFFFSFAVILDSCKNPLI